MRGFPSTRRPRAGGPLAWIALSTLSVAAAPQAGTTEAADPEATVELYTEQLDTDLTLVEVRQGDLAMSDYYELDYRLHASHVVSAELRRPRGAPPGGRVVEFTRIGGEHSLGGESDPGEPAALESRLTGARVAFGDSGEARLLDGDERSGPLLPGLRDGFDRAAFGPPQPLHLQPAWTLRDDEALALFDATGPLGRELEEELGPARTAIVFASPFELHALLEGADRPEAELKLTRVATDGPVSVDEPLALELKASGTSDLLPALRRASRQAGDEDLWEGATRLEARWTLDAKGVAAWDEERRVLHGIVLDGTLELRAELAFQPDDRGLPESEFELEVSGSLRLLAEHERE